MKVSHLMKLLTTLRHTYGDREVFLFGDDRWEPLVGVEFDDVDKSVDEKTYEIFQKEKVNDK